MSKTCTKCGKINDDMVEWCVECKGRNFTSKENSEKIDESKLYFETVPISKIVWLSIFTFGLYEIVWFYNIWKTLDKKFGYKNSSVLRAIFAPFTSFWLFPVLSRYIKKFNLKSFNAILFSILYLVLCAFFRLSNALWLIGFADIVIIAVIQSKINKVNKKNFSEATINKWCGINIFWALLGGILLSLNLLGTFYPSIYEQQNIQNKTEIQQVQKQTEGMKEYNFKYISLLCPEQFMEVQSKDNQIADYEYKRYVTDTDKDIVILIEEGTLNEKVSIKATMYNAIVALLGEEKAIKIIENAVTLKDEKINQSSCDYQNGLWGYKTLTFTKENKYVVVTICFDKTQKNLISIAKEIVDSIKILM